MTKYKWIKQKESKPKNDHDTDFERWFIMYNLKKDKK